MDQRRMTGAQGEQIAVAHLEGLGWTVVDRNWRSACLELDVAAFRAVQAKRGIDYAPSLDPANGPSHRGMFRPAVSSSVSVRAEP